MIRKIFFLLSLLCLSCSSDNIISSEKTSLYNVYVDILKRKPAPSPSKNVNDKTVYDRAWLSKFKQPIILLSSLDGKNKATLVALGNYKNKLTWVSADGVSVSFLNGILIATRGYSQDLIESQYSDLKTFFTNRKKSHSKILRYLNGENDYEETTFHCSLSAEVNIASSFLNLTITTTKFTEVCKAENMRHSNEYYVLPDTDIVLKSKQWISEKNGSIVIYNYYAFQNNLL